jgi:hypothetical protein
MPVALWRAKISESSKWETASWFHLPYPRYPWSRLKLAGLSRREEKTGTREKQLEKRQRSGFGAASSEKPPAAASEVRLNWVRFGKYRVPNDLRVSSGRGDGVW